MPKHHKKKKPKEESLPKLNDDAVTSSGSPTLSLELAEAVANNISEEDEDNLEKQSLLTKIKTKKVSINKLEEASLQFKARDQKKLADLAEKRSAQLQKEVDKLEKKLVSLEHDVQDESSPGASAASFNAGAGAGSDAPEQSVGMGCDEISGSRPVNPDYVFVDNDLAGVVDSLNLST